MEVEVATEVHFQVLLMSALNIINGPEGESDNENFSSATFANAGHA
jgi:hypothetical protein